MKDSKVPVAKQNTYDASDIEVLEGLEPVRKRPGMYVGGTDERAMHHLVNEILDNAMDEAVAGHANLITLHLMADGTVVISDNGRGIPVDPHPKFPKKSALEVIVTTLHAGGKFSGKAYATAGGLHGVGISVVCALSENMRVEVARDGQLYQQNYAKGTVASKLLEKGPTKNRGTVVTFRPDPEIFGTTHTLKAEWIYKLARSKAYLFRGVAVEWSCDEAVAGATPAQARFQFPDGLKDYLKECLEKEGTILPEPFYWYGDIADGQGRIECAITWLDRGDGFLSSYCNTIPTPQGGTHEAGLRAALTKSIRGYAELIGHKKASIITTDDVLNGMCGVLSLFIRDPQFQGQTKDKLASADATRLVETALKDHMDHWLTGQQQAARALVDAIIERAEDRLSRREEKAQGRKSATRRLRLPGKLADCSRNDAAGTELFIVEGDSAGGSAKQARNRETQAILPLRGKILNVVSATNDKIKQNQEIQDLIQALGCGTGKNFDVRQLRYERIIIMTDADVDGAHIASLLMTFFYTQMPDLLRQHHLYLALPPLYRLSAGGESIYARDDAHKDELMQSRFKGRKVDISRFKGLGEMPATQLKETTMNPDTRTLVRVTIPAATSAHDTLALASGDAARAVDDLVERLMGKNADARFQFIQTNAAFVQDIDI